MKIKEKTNFSIRNKRNTTIVAQKIILDHIRMAVEFRQCGYNKFSFGETVPYEAVDIPTYKDYEIIKQALLKDELTVFDDFSTEAFLIPVPNFRNLGYKNGKWAILRRPEDEFHAPKETPLIKCLAVRKKALEDNAELVYPRFKSRSDFEKFLIYIRAFLIGIPIQKAITKYKQQKNESGSYYLSTLKKSPDFIKYSLKQQSKITKNFIKQTGYNQLSKKEITPRQWVIRYIFNRNKENYNKIYQRLIKNALIC